MDNNSRGDCPDNIDNDGAAVVCLNDMNNDDGGRPSRLNNIDSDGAAVVRLNDEDFDSDSRGGFFKNFCAVIFALGAPVAASPPASAPDGFWPIIEPSPKALVSPTPTSPPATLFPGRTAPRPPTTQSTL